MNVLYFPLRTVVVSLLISGLVSACIGDSKNSCNCSPLPSETPAPGTSTPTPAPTITPVPASASESGLIESSTSKASTPIQTKAVPASTTTTPIAEFGVFTEKPTSGGFNLSQNSPATYQGDFYAWNDTLITEIKTLADSSKILIWQWQAAAGWFGGGIGSVANNTIDLSEFSAGNLKFRIQIPAEVNFAISIIGSDRGQNWINFPAHQTIYGLVRNGDWAEASIPISDLTAGKVSLQSITYPFAFKSIDGAAPNRPFKVSLDDIIWEAQSTDSLPAYCPKEAATLYHTDIRCVPSEIIEECDAAGGSMQTVGLMRWYRCIYTFNDGQQVCTDGSQCDSGSCRDTTSYGFYDTRPTSGKCSSSSNTFGCYSDITNGQAGYMMCRD